MEFFDVIDKNRNPLNKIMPRNSILGNNEFNIGVEVWIINSRKEILMTQRSVYKSHSNLWECPGGCSIAGETSLQTLKREISEENDEYGSRDRQRALEELQGTHKEGH